jgi:flagellar basal-body rod protein FlgB
MLEEIDLFRLTGDRMRYLTERQAAIARNVANADTPAYQAQDLAPFSFSSMLLRDGPAAANLAAPLALARTSPGHFAIQPGALPTPRTLSPATYGEKPNGNTVSLEEQMVKSADVSNAFALASAAYAKSLTLMKIGIDSGK